MVQSVAMSPLRAILIMALSAHLGAAKPFFTFPAFGQPFVQPFQQGFVPFLNGGAGMFQSGMASVGNMTGSTSNATGLNPSAFHQFTASGLQAGLGMANTGLSSMSSFASNVPMFGSHLQSVSGMAQKGINTFGAFGLGGLAAIESQRQSMSSLPATGQVSSSFVSSSSSQNGNDPPKIASNSFSAVQQLG